MSRECLTRFLFIFMFFIYTVYVWLKLSVCTRVFSLCFEVCFLTFYMLSDGTEFELRVAMLLLFLLLFLLFSTSRFKLFWFAFKVDVFWKLQKTELFRLNVFCIFLVIFLFFFLSLQLSIRLQLHTETKGSILNHSISYQYFFCFFFLDRSLRVLRLPRGSIVPALAVISFAWECSVINENVNKENKKKLIWIWQNWLSVSAIVGYCFAA